MFDSPLSASAYEVLGVTPSTTHDDMRRAYRQRLREAHPDTGGDAALVFTCNGRGARLFGEPDHDASVVGDHLDGGPAAGMFCAGEIGPVGSRSFVHGFTASVLLFDR